MTVAVAAVGVHRLLAVAFLDGLVMRLLSHRLGLSKAYRLVARCE
ncbi:hypothetical protein Scel_76600 [Streptomyces cellostaticus]|nr:hypothetical protein [Streptomyces cellostaticus]GHI09339.1 hypothetical protein Scel_76600 [Streptomyces cellostaticus]